MKPWRYLCERDAVRSPGSVCGRTARVLRVAWTGLVPGSVADSPGASGFPVIQTATGDYGPMFLCVPDQMDWVAYNRD